MEVIGVVIIIIGAEIIITTIIIMVAEEVLVMLTPQMETDMAPEMVPEIQIIPTEEAILQLRVREIIPQDLQTVLLETIIILQQEVIILRNPQEVITLRNQREAAQMSQLQFVPILQVLPDHPLHMEVEVMVAEAAAEDHLQEAEEDKKQNKNIYVIEQIA